MNLYVRYFDQEALTHSVNEVVDFLTTIPDIHITPELVADLQDYAASDMPYPKRYKVRPRVYFILIKTTAATLADFKMNKKAQAAAEVSEPVIRKETKQSLLTQQRSGWYMGTIVFSHPRHIQISVSGYSFLGLRKGRECAALLRAHRRPPEESAGRRPSQPIPLIPRK